jgi:coenzyme F420-0:L-glutamate ligase/coenzyme F420-1:gamma-L-glutamate ligase
MKRLELIGLEDIKDVGVGDSIGRLVCEACSRLKIDLRHNDVLVVAQKIVSKSEGRIVALDDVQPSARAVELARTLDKEPALVEVILGESLRVIRSGGRALIVETHPMSA